jgi:valyl-tRNA synthetase
MLRSEQAVVRQLARLAEVRVELGAKPAGAAAVMAGRTVLQILLAGVVDVGRELGRLAKQRAEVETELGGIERKLSNEQFRARAPREVVERSQQRAEELRERVGRLRESEERLRAMTAVSES